jgi:hypothetical protein
MEQQQDNLDNLVSAFNATVKKEWEFIQTYSWNDKDDFKKRSEGFDLHYMIVSGRVVNAEKIMKKAVSEGKGGRPDIGKILKEARRFFAKYKEDCEKYTSQSDFVALVESGENISLEIKFQSDISSKLIALEQRMNNIGDSTKASKVNVSLHGDVLIPILLSDVAENEYPEILDFLNERKETETKRVSEQSS